jgi:glutamine amidotransferase-like uncharacterized protein
VFDEGNAAVLARYTDLPGMPPAIIETAVGRGRAILSSPHPERLASDLRKALYRHLNSSYEWDKAAIDKLDENGQGAAEIQRLLFNRALDRE